MRVLAAAALALVAGCSSSQSALAPGSTPSQTVVNAPGAQGGMTVSRQEAIVSTSFSASPDAVWSAVAEVFTEIGIPVDQIDQSARAASATNQRVRRLMGKSLGTYFNCAGPFGNAANRDDVFLTIRTQVVPGQGTGSSLRMSVGAVARSTTAANTATDCGSNGELETLIAQKIAEKVGA